MVPAVINRHHYKGKAMPRPWVYVGRGTPLGNQFTVKEHGEAALELYRQWLWAQLNAKSPAVLSAFREITAEHSLVCSCKPRACHGDVIVSAWRWLFRGGGWGSLA